jgi:hypothetical protein
MSLRISITITSIIIACGIFISCNTDEVRFEGKWKQEKFGFAAEILKIDNKTYEVKLFEKDGRQVKTFDGIYTLTAEKTLYKKVRDNEETGLGEYGMTITISNNKLYFGEMAGDEFFVRVK